MAVLSLLSRRNSHYSKASSLLRRLVAICARVCVCVRVHVRVRVRVRVHVRVCVRERTFLLRRVAGSMPIKMGISVFPWNPCVCDKVKSYFNLTLDF